MINDYYFLICTSFSLPKTVGAKSVVRREHTCNTRLFLFIFAYFFSAKGGGERPFASPLSTLVIGGKGVISDFAWGGGGFQRQSTMSILASDRGSGPVYENQNLPSQLWYMRFGCHLIEHLLKRIRVQIFSISYFSVYVCQFLA